MVENGSNKEKGQEWLKDKNKSLTEERNYEDSLKENKEWASRSHFLIYFAAFCVCTMHHHMDDVSHDAPVRNLDASATLQKGQENLTQKWE